MATPVLQTEGSLTFGPFRLVASERLLTRDAIPVKVSARAFDILAALTSRPNEVVSKRDLVARVWPDVTVEEGSLRFHMTGLRKALGDGKEGARYIATLPGRGYCFVAPVQRSDVRLEEPTGLPSFPHGNLPARPAGMVGRDEDVLKLSARLHADRFVTIVGVGGIGKTTVAIAVGHHLADTFAGAVLFIDLGMLSDPDLVAPAVASMMGLSVQSNDVVPSLISYLRGKHVLLILDTCEHLIEAAAALASRAFAEAPDVHILATSRESLQSDGEQVYRLEPLSLPPEECPITPAVAQNFSATRLFVERAEAAGARLDLNDADAAIVVAICRKLDGVALAIELAARRVDAHGLHQTSVLLDQSLTLHWLGSRSAPARQKTLQATLDWSYGLLSEVERSVLRRLAIFVGQFTLDAALAVVTSAKIDKTAVFGAIDSLVAKSMIATRPTGAVMRYRLLDTTRAYVLDLGIADAERADLAVRHATYYRRWIEETGSAWPTYSTGKERAPHFTGLNNVRAALEWCFAEGGDVRVGVGLAAAAAPVFLAMSLLMECHRWSERAVQALDDATRSGREEMNLQTALGVSLMFTRGGMDAARMALDRSLAIAEEHGDARDQLQILGPLHMFHLRTGGFNIALGYARRCSDIAKAQKDSAATILAHALMGMSLHLGGDLRAARVELESALRLASRSKGITTAYLGFDSVVLAGSILARTLWLQGCPAQAAERAYMAVEDAAGMDNALTLSVVLNWAVSVFLWTGDLERAEEHIDWILSRAELHSFGPYLMIGRGFKGEVAIRRGDANGGVESLVEGLKALHAAPYELLTTTLNIALVEGFAATGKSAEALALIDETILLVKANGELCYLPELLRVKGNVLLATALPRAEEAEMCFRQSLELSRRQGARGWELRTANDLAALLAAQGKRERARVLLQPAFEQFAEGAGTADLQAAERLLVTLSADA